MNIDQIFEVYGEEKTERLFQSLLDTPHHLLAEEVLESWSDSYIEELMKSYK